jgi:NADH-quinone oxidoreductase subunit E
LWRIQERDGWLSEPALRAAAERLGMSYARAYEVATFYTMFDLEPKGRHLVQICGTTPCRLRGAGELVEHCKKRFGAEDSVSEDGQFTWREVECAGACCNAPIVWIGKDYYEDLTLADFEKLLDALAAGQSITPGSARGRRSSEPQNGARTLTDSSLYDGTAGKTGGTLPNALVETPRLNDGDAPGQPGIPREADRALAENGDLDQSTLQKENAPYTPGRGSESPGDGLEPGEAVEPGFDHDESISLDDPRRPAPLKGPEGIGPDDLQAIDALGPNLEASLHELGIFHYHQIGAFTDENITWLQERLQLKDRITREGWVEQARALAAMRKA